jgi:hypothetical protein
VHSWNSQMVHHKRLILIAGESLYITVTLSKKMTTL